MPDLLSEYWWRHIATIHEKEFETMWQGALAASSPPATVADERSVRSGSPNKTQKERGEGAAE